MKRKASLDFAFIIYISQFDFKYGICCQQELLSISL